jgi:hypothetical protein
MVIDIRQKILESNDIKTEIVEVPEWGVKIEIRGLSGGRRAKVVEAVSNKENPNLIEMYALMVIETAFDPESHQQIFRLADKEALMDKNAGILERLAAKAMALSGLNDEAEQEAEKN